MISFRIDDIGIDNDRYLELIKLFKKYQIKFTSGVIPFLDDLRFVENNLGQYWVHGFKHHNYSTNEMKNEYPCSRDVQEVINELKSAFGIVKQTYNRNFFPGFIPPWNRIGVSHYPALKTAGFKALSTDKLIIINLEQVNINIDIHTNKKIKFDCHKDIINMINTFDRNGFDAHVMLHHNHMNYQDFVIFDKLLGDLDNTKIKWLSEFIE